MRNGKYIVVENVISGGSDIIIFPNHINHMDMVLQLSLSRNDVSSAGFVDFCPEEASFYCYGESKSIGVKSDSLGDTILLKSLFIC